MNRAVHARKAGGYASPACRAFTRKIQTGPRAAPDGAQGGASPSGRSELVEREPTPDACRLADRSRHLSPGPAFASGSMLAGHIGEAPGVPRGRRRKQSWIEPDVSGAAPVRGGRTTRRAGSAGDRAAPAGPGHREAASAILSGNASPRDVAAARSCIVFECRFARHLFCAIPTSCPIPDFLIGPAWRFRGTLGKRGFALSGFKPASARAAVHRDGFYLFMSPGCGK
jgi:hypothetical protein